MRPMRPAALAALLGAAALALAGCGAPQPPPAEGAKCTSGAKCLSGGYALDCELTDACYGAGNCQDRVYRKVHCAGGCSVSGDTLSCEVQGDADRDACPPSGATTLGWCNPDGHPEMLACDGRTVSVSQGCVDGQWCPQLGPCKENGTCDDSSGTATCVAP